MTPIANYLKQADIFFQLTSAQLEMVASLCREVRFNEGELIVTEGSQTKDLYVIVAGEVDILVSTALLEPPGTRLHDAIVARLRRGQSFGEVALVDEGLRSASARAVQGGTRLLVIPRQELLMLCEAYPQLGYRLMFNLAADLAMKIRNTDFQLREQLLYRRPETAREDPPAGT
jgi:CRP-like cAMP-binding protein